MNIDFPANGAVVRQPFVIAGWAFDATAATGHRHHDAARLGLPRVRAHRGSSAWRRMAARGPDVGGVFGAAVHAVRLRTRKSRGCHRARISSWCSAGSRPRTASRIVRTVNVTIGSSTLLFIDRPRTCRPSARPFLLAGWTFDSERPDRHRRGHDSRLGVSRVGWRADLRRRPGLRRVRPGRWRLLRQRGSRRAVTTWRCRAWRRACTTSSSSRTAWSRTRSTRRRWFG